MKARVNITIGPTLHAGAKAHAQNLEMDFSELVTQLLREELLNAERLANKPSGSAAEKAANKFATATQRLRVQNQN